MPSSSLHTTRLHALLDRMREDDPAACAELLRLVGGRLERLARKMLRDFPGVARWEQTDDVLQNAVVRLLRALQEIRPPSVRAFFGLAATQMRRELLDLARHYQGPRGLGTHHDSRMEPAPDEGTVAPPEPAADAGAANKDLEKWCAFHEQVERLSGEEREVVSLAFYHGWTQAEIAALFQVTERTIRRHWQAACMKLHEALAGALPEP